jgi:glycosyltransferase involved in cell wall biosynthesis
MIDSFQRQTYFEKELVLIVDRWEELEACGGMGARIIVRPDSTLGEKRNAGCSEAQGEYIAHFDEDDWSAPGRVADQLCRLQLAGKQVTAYDSIVFHELRDVKILEEAGLRPTNGWWKLRSGAGAIAGTSLFYRRDWWELHPFPPVISGEDDQFWREASLAGVTVAGDGTRFMYATNHHGGCSGRFVGGVEWEELPKNPFHVEKTETVLERQ